MSTSAAGSAPVTRVSGRGPAGRHPPIILRAADKVRALDAGADRVGRVLARNPGRLIIQQEILRAVWGEGYQKETHYLRAIVRFTEHFLCVSFI